MAKEWRRACGCTSASCGVRAAARCAQVVSRRRTSEVPSRRPLLDRNRAAPCGSCAAAAAPAPGVRSSGAACGCQRRARAECAQRRARDAELEIPGDRPQRGLSDGDDPRLGTLALDPDDLAVEPDRVGVRATPVPRPAARMRTRARRAPDHGARAVSSSGSARAGRRPPPAPARAAAAVDAGASRAGQPGCRRVPRGRPARGRTRAPRRACVRSCSAPDRPATGRRGTGESTCRRSCRAPGRGRSPSVRADRSRSRTHARSWQPPRARGDRRRAPRAPRARTARSRTARRRAGSACRVRLDAASVLSWRARNSSPAACDLPVCKKLQNSASASDGYATSTSVPIGVYG